MAGNLSKAKMSAKPDVAESSSKRQHGMSDNKSKDIVQSKTQQKPRNFAKQIEFFDDDVNFDPYNQDDNPTGKFRAGDFHETQDYVGHLLKVFRSTF